MCPHCSKAFSRSDNLAQYVLPNFPRITNHCVLTFNRRHKRTHSREDGGEGIVNLSGEEEEYSGEDQLGPLEETSPGSDDIFDGSSHLVSDPSPHTIQPSQTYNGLQGLGMSFGPSAINANSMM